MGTIKVIDLLVNIANGEIELGTRFNWHYKCYDIELIFTKRYGALGLYFQQEGRLVGLFERFNYQILNEEVEIIEDTPKEDKKIEYIDYLVFNEFSNENKVWYLSNKINEIIDKLNGE